MPQGVPVTCTCDSGWGRGGGGGFLKEFAGSSFASLESLSIPGSVGRFISGGGDKPCALDVALSAGRGEAAVLNHGCFSLCETERRGSRRCDSRGSKRGGGGSAGGGGRRCQGTVLRDRLFLEVMRVLEG